MTVRRIFSTLLVTSLVMAVVVSALMPAATPRAQAQSNAVLQVSVPSLWEDTLTPELLAEFEAQHPGVAVELKFSDTSFFGVATGLTDIETQLSELFLRWIAQRPVERAGPPPSSRSRLRS